MNERNDEIIRWLSKLEEYAMEAGLPGRIQDRIKECKNRLYHETMEPDRLQREIEEILGSIRKKTGIVENKSNTTNQNFTAQDVEMQMKRIVQRCKDENERTKESIQEQEIIILNKYYEKLKEITRTKAHLEELRDEVSYARFFDNMAVAYRREVSFLISEMLEGLRSNYTHMLNKMKNLFQEMGQVGMERNFYEVEQKRESIAGKLQGEMETRNEAGREIQAFAQNTGDRIKNIVKSTERKKKIYSLLPALLIAFMVLVPGVIGVLGALSSTENVATEENISEQEASGFDMFLTVLENADAIDSLLSTIGMLTLPLLCLLVFVVVMVVVFYVLYIKHLKKKCDEEIARKSAEYLQGELAAFCQGNSLKSMLDEMIKNVVNEYEQQHTALLNQSFFNTGSQTECREQDSFTKLLMEWEDIQRGTVISNG